MWLFRAFVARADCCMDIWSGKLPPAPATFWPCANAFERAERLLFSAAPAVCGWPDAPLGPDIPLDCAFGTATLKGVPDPACLWSVGLGPLDDIF